jgi:molecular chaperone DnaK
MAKDSRASAILGREKKKQPQKGGKGRSKKAHSVHARRVENGYHSETRFKGDDREEETQEHIHPDIQALLDHMRSNLGDEQQEAQSASGAGGDGAAPGEKKEDVVDAEFTEVDDDKKKSA